MLTFLWVCRYPSKLQRFLKGKIDIFYFLSFNGFGEKFYFLFIIKKKIRTKEAFKVIAQVVSREDFSFCMHNFIKSSKRRNCICSKTFDYCKIQ